LTVVWASMADKDVATTAAAMVASSALDGATVVCTAVDAPRALAPPALAEAWRAGAALAGRSLAVDAAATPDAALDRVLAGRGAPGTGPIVIAGSLYLVGQARARLVDDPLLRDPVAT
ncbi:MAG TPA: hypothetical protein VKB30_02800, partial [Candidatus Limnocylindrales bacterium]|nr:hypothetical protein [Candidatus Limnocylindrales bacterium]